MTFKPSTRTSLRIRNIAGECTSSQLAHTAMYLHPSACGAINTNRQVEWTVGPQCGAVDRIAMDWIGLDRSGSVRGGLLRGWPRQRHEQLTKAKLLDHSSSSYNTGNANGAQSKITPDYYWILGIFHLLKSNQSMSCSIFHKT